MQGSQQLWIPIILCAVCIQCANADNPKESLLPTKKPADSIALSTMRGFLFANGKFVSPPYLLGTSEKGKLIVNGTAFQLERGFESPRSGRSDIARRVSNRVSGGRGSGERGFNSSPADHVYGWLESRSLVILSDKLPQPEVYDASDVYDILKALLDQSGASMNAIPLSIRSHLPGLRSDMALMARSEEFTSAEDAMGERNRKSFQSVRRLDQFASPLSLAGMLLIVFSTGQLLLKRPPEGKE